MSSPVYDKLIDHPNAWTPEDGIGRFVRQLSPQELVDITSLLTLTRMVEAAKVERSQFSTPAIDRLMDELREVIMNGAGVVLLKGVTPDRFSDDDMYRLYWGLGTHLGRGLPQSRQMEMIGLVQEEDSNPNARGYRSSNALGMHTDAFEIVGLMCVRRAERGGESSLASALTMHNKILAERPELLPALYEGYYFVLQELQFTDRPTTEVKVPIFSNKDGVVSVNAASSYMRHAAELRNEPFPPDLDEALRYFDEVANRADVRAEFLLDDGDILLWNNYTHLHSRRGFRNSAERKRLLLRLWLEVEKGRDVQPDYAIRGRSFRWVHDQDAA